MIGQCLKKKAQPEGAASPLCSIKILTGWCKTDTRCAGYCLQLVNKHKPVTWNSWICIV